MNVTHQFSLPPAEVFDALTTPEYLAARQKKFGGVGEPVIAEDASSVVVTTKRQLPLDKIPGAFRGFVGDGQITQIDRWNGAEAPEASPTSGTWSATVGTAPATIGGTHQLDAVDGGTQYTIGIDVSIKIPLVGGKLESQVSGYLEYLIGKELDYLDQWIASR